MMYNYVSEQTRLELRNCASRRHHDYIQPPRSPSVTSVLLSLLRVAQRLILVKPAFLYGTSRDQQYIR